MTYTQALCYIDSLKSAGIQPGLSRMQQALTALNHPERALRAVHVAGTNGKGSTSRMVQAMTTAAGYKTGLYTSPTVTDIRDTCTIDGHPISKADFAALVTRLQATAEAFSLTEFEMMTVLALCYFAQEKTALCVIECGLGGREDATNVFDTKAAAVITPIALDHTALLGNTLAEIAVHKSGILRPGCPVITTPAQEPEVLGVLFEAAAAQGCTVYMPQTASPMAGNAFTWQGEPYTLSLLGDFQRDNALLALETAAQLARQGFVLPLRARQEGLAAVAMPCRQERVCDNPLLLLDGAHNPHGIAALARTLRALPAQPITAVMGMLADKDVAACTALLAPLFTQVVCCTPASPRALPASLLAAYFPHALAVPDPLAALAAAQRLADGGALVVCGSFTVAGVLRPLVTKKDRI